MMAQGVVEPEGESPAIKSATEAATMVLRVDDVIAAKREEMTPSPQSPMTIQCLRCSLLRRM